MRQVSREGIELIKRFEGLETQAYRDIAGVWTIGYGHTGPEVGQGMTITPAEAEDLLIRDLERFEDAVASSVKTSITQSQFDALVSLTYNIGASAFRRSTALKRLNKGDFEGAAEAITWWNKATVNGEKRPVLGLTRRRAAEAALFLQDVHDDEVRGGGVVVEENSPRRRNPMNSRTVGGATTAGAAGAVGAGSAVVRGRDGTEDAGPQAEATSDRGPASSDQADAQSGSGDDGTGEQGGTDTTASADGDVEAPVGCVDRETGEYLIPSEAAAGGPLSPNGPIDADAADVALEAVEPAFCDEIEVAQSEHTSEVATPADPPPNERDTADAIGIGAGALAVLAALYTIGARLDDWLKFRR